MSELTQAQLKEELYYNKQFGIFVYRERKRGRPLGVAGAVHPLGYRFITLNKKRYPVHRLAFLYVEGKMPEDQIDHINHIRMDNRWSNLRHATAGMNARNRSRQRRNKSGITGVRWVKKYSVWSSCSVAEGKSVNGYWGNDFFEACCARKSFELKAGYHKNNGSTPILALS